MEYEKIILDLMNRVCVLEEKVRTLEGTYKNNNKSYDSREIKSNVSNVQKIVEYITNLILEARNNGMNHLVLRAGDIEKAMGLYQRTPSICNAMRKVGADNRLIKTYTIIRDTNSHNSTTYTLDYEIA